jgi:hypothetical protein
VAGPVMHDAECVEVGIEAGAELGVIDDLSGSR